MVQRMPLPLTVSCFSKIQIGFTFWYRLTRVVLEKGPLNGCVCVFVLVAAAAALAVLSAAVTVVTMATCAWRKDFCRIVCYGGVVNTALNSWLKKSWVWVLAVRVTTLPLSPSSIIWYQSSGWWNLAAGKVIVSLALHWPYITDFRVLSTYRLMPTLLMGSVDMSMCLMGHTLPYLLLYAALNECPLCGHSARLIAPM